MSMCSVAAVVLLLAAGAAESAERAVPQDRSLGFFAGLVPYAKSVGIATVTESRVEAIEDVLKTEPGKTAWCEVASVEWQTMFYGTKEKADGNTVGFAAMPPRAADKPAPALKKGEKLIVLQIRQPEHKWTFDGAVAWSKEAEAATLEALAPGWTREGKAFLCPWCTGRKVTADLGKCTACGAQTSSGMYKLCPACAATSGHCQGCDRTAGPATPFVKFGLGTIDPKYGQKDPLLLNIAPGAWPTLQVSVEMKAGPVPEFVCLGGNLWECETVFVLVETASGAPAVAFRAAFDGPRPTDRVALASSASAPFPVMSWRVNPFAARGTYTVRAVAGRLVSNPVTVVMKDLGAGGDAAGGPPAGVSIDADGKSLSRMQDGKMVWKMALGFAIGQVTEDGGKLVINSADGSTQVVVDTPSGKILERRAMRPDR